MDNSERAIETSKIISLSERRRQALVAQFVGPYSAKMYEKVRSLRSRLDDTFDWSIYDQIANRFGPNQPRGGVVFKTNLKLVNFHSTCTKCHYSFEIDTYGRGCIHNCIYCYAKESLTQHGYWNQPMPFPIDLSEVRKIFHAVFETDKSNKWREILQQRVPLRIGSMSDSFMHMDKKYGVTKELLRILKFYEYPYVIFTRSDLVAEDEYLSLMDQRLAAVQFSICGGNEKLTRILEPGAPSIGRRFVALRKLADSGFWTTVRINPLLPTYPDGYFTDLRSIRERFGDGSSVPRLDFFDIDKAGDFIDQIQDAKVPSVLVGFARLSKYANLAIFKATGIEIKKFFRTDIPQDARDKRYTDSEIAYYYKVIQSECAKRGIRFSTCYIGNGIKDYFQYQHTWSNLSDCCDVRGNVAKFSASAQEISWDLRKRFAQNQGDYERGKTLDLISTAENGGFTPGLTTNADAPIVEKLVSEKST